MGNSLSTGFLFALVWFAAISPVRGEISPRVTLSPDTATIGDPFTLQITLPNATPDRITWPDLESGVVGDFHLLAADTLVGKPAKQYGGPTLSLTMAVYDTGSASTGELSVGVDGEMITLPERHGTILSVLSDSTGSQFRPLKAQEDLPVTFWDMVGYLGPYLLGLIVLVLLYFLVRRLLRRKKRFEEENLPPPVPPYDEALASLTQLRKENPLARGDQKGYVTGLTLIVKRLLERVHGDPVLEMTTGEVRRWIRQPKVRFDGTLLISLLDAADGVKFAKLPLEVGTADGLMHSTEQMVEAYKPRDDEPETGMDDSEASDESSDEADTSPETVRKSNEVTTTEEGVK